MDLKSAQERSKAVNKKFMKTRKMEWKPEVMLADMAEEMGELATSILVGRGFKTKKGKQVEDLADCLCDILFVIFMIADYYGVDMDKEYDTVLKKITERIESGEFSDS